MFLESPQGSASPLHPIVLGSLVGDPTASCEFSICSTCTAWPGCWCPGCPVNGRSRFYFGGPFSFLSRVPGRVRAVRRVVLDSTAVYPIFDAGAYRHLRSLIDQKQLEVLFTHVTVDECSATPKQAKRNRLLWTLFGLGVGPVPTGAFVLGVSELGAACLGPANDQAFEDFRSNNPTHLNNTRDALIAVTAQTDGCALVTNDDRLGKAVRAHGVEVMTTDELLTQLGFDVEAAARGRKQRKA